MKYVYFVSYNIKKDNKDGYGNSEIIYPDKIKYIDQIREIERVLNEDMGGKCLIKAFQLLRKER